LTSFKNFFGQTKQTLTQKLLGFFFKKSHKLSKQTITLLTATLITQEPHEVTLQRYDVVEEDISLDDESE
jgi:hypothetical protein